MDFREEKLSTDNWFLKINNSESKCMLCEYCFYCKGSLLMFITWLWNKFPFVIRPWIVWSQKSKNSSQSKTKANLSWPFVSWLRNWLKIISTWGLRDQLAYLNTKIYSCPQLDFNECWVKGKCFSCYYTYYLASPNFYGSFWFCNRGWGVF